MEQSMRWLNNPRHRMDCFAALAKTILPLHVIPRSGFLPLAMLAACSDKPESAESRADAEAQAARSSAEDGRILCATAGQSGFAPDCALEQAAGPGGTILTIRHPDGGFRRLAIARDGRGVVAADGAETAVVTPLSGGLIEVALGDARYRLPATVKASQ